MAARSYGQYCGVVRALELVGERWALLIVRDLLVGPRRYSDLKSGLSRIPTNILSDRLKDLQAAGLVHRVPVARCGLVYELTPYGRELEDVILALGRWGFKAMTGPREGEEVTADSLTMALRTAFDPAASRRVPATVFTLHVGDVTLVARSDAGRLDVVAPSRGPVPVATPMGDGDRLEFAAAPGIRDLIAGTVTPADAVASGAAEVLDGDVRLLERFAALFHLDAAVAA
ncbi:MULTISPECIES: helix-turn-helix domain-containing protein [Arthrobacter]|uniref:Helix-turn-helix domain-containing protein n=2 Tax=Arthrobacter TaxID=1663 RepID=A0ABU9KIV4_9MICC|nr:helix-turn-helix domain-containing protein [Arthrobacter sp. YJM1]MDP5226936.1 helix-turn-helix domain-containing protein [Arthrobacter sp. YJM1]